MNELMQLAQQKPYMALFFVVLALVLVFALGIGAGRISNSFKFKKIIEQERNDAVKRSRAVLGGQVGEQLAPFLPEFPCNPGDVRFVGKPVDYVGFPGSAEGKPIEEVLFIEVKSGQSQLSGREKEIRDCIRQGKVRYVEYRI